MKTYSGHNAGSSIEPILWNARKAVWIISPWVGKDYAKQLVSLSQKGIEVRVVTSNVDYNSESLAVFKASDNPKLILLVLDKEKVGFIHSKLYIVDRAHAISGSANLTYSGLNSNVESLSIAETREEVQQIENDFMRIWMSFERKSMSNEELSVEVPHSIKYALPLSVNYGNIDHPNIKSKELVYHPYYFFEFSFRASAGKSPPILFENSGFIMLDGVTRQLVNDYRLFEEVKNHTIDDYLLKTENKYLLRIHEPKIRDFREAKEIVLDHIIKVNTKHYTQNYGSRSYDRIFVPYRRIIRFIRSGLVRLPLWYIERHEPDGRRHQDIVLGASGKKWKELLYCPECQKKIWLSQAIKCKMCGKQVCQDCINEVGLIFKKKLCSSCLSKSK
jgi:hypothetical protein